MHGEGAPVRRYGTVGINCIGLGLGNITQRTNVAQSRTRAVSGTLMSILHWAHGPRHATGHAYGGTGKNAIISHGARDE